MINLPEGYTIVQENDIAILAHNVRKQEYVAWTKDINGGVCWGHYFSYNKIISENEPIDALNKAKKAFKEKSK